MAQFTIPIVGAFGLAYANQATGLGYTVYSSTGNVLVSRQTSGIAEELDDSLSRTGSYSATLTADTAWGQYVKVRWDWPTGTNDGIIAEQTIDIQLAFKGGVPGVIDLSAALTPVQRELYKDTCNVYRKATTKHTDGREKVTYTLIYENMLCKHWTTDNFDAPTGIGEQKVANIMTSDRLKYPVNFTVNADDMIEITTVGSPAFERWFSVQAAEKVKATLGDVAFKQVYVVPSADPRRV